MIRPIRKVLAGQCNNMQTILFNIIHGMQQPRSTILSPSEGIFNYINIPPHERYKIQQSMIEDYQSELSNQVEEDQEVQIQVEDNPTQNLN